MPDPGAVVAWLGLSVALPLSAIFLVRLAAWLLSRNKTLVVILRDGQLYFFSSTLAAVAFYDLLSAARGTMANLAFLAALIAFSMFVYGIAVVQADTNRPEDHRIARMSIWTTIGTIFIVFGIRWQAGLLG